MKAFESDVNYLKDKVKKLTKEIDNNYSELVEKIEILDPKVEKLNTCYEDLKLKIENINISLMDSNFNKDNNMGNMELEGDISSNLVKSMIQNLEKKIFKKFEFVDEKQKKSEEDIYKIKNELTTIKNNYECLTVNIKNASDKIKENTDSINDNKQNIKNMYESTELLKVKVIKCENNNNYTNMENEFKIIKDDLKKLNDKLDTHIKLKADEDKKEDLNIDPKTSNATNKKLNEIENKLKIILG